MGDIIDFNKAKENKQTQETKKLKVQKKNKKLIKKMKRYDQGSPLKYYLYILLGVVIFVAFRMLLF
jgi:hypothetical protein